jgi:hypothetical protein
VFILVQLSKLCIVNKQAEYNLLYVGQFFLHVSHDRQLKECLNSECVTCLFEYTTFAANLLSNIRSSNVIRRVAFTSYFLFQP